MSLAQGQNGVNGSHAGAELRTRPTGLGTSSLPPPPYVHGRIYPAGERISSNIIPPRLPLWDASASNSSSADGDDVPAIVIDNGSSELRAGFALPGAGGADTAPPLVFDSVISRYRDRKRSTNLLLVGSDAYVDTQSRSGVRRPFDMDVVCNYDVMECVLDFTFARLGVEGERVQHPLLLTETLCNPAYSRAQMNEMLFECYGAPAVAYGLDALFSAYANDVQDGLVVSSGRASTLVIPLVDRKALVGNSKRLNWGGHLATEYLLRLVQLKYPSFPLRVSSTQAAWMLEQFTFFPSASTVSGVTTTSGADSYEEFVGALPAPYEKKMEPQRPPPRGAVLPPAKPTIRPLAHGIAELDRVIQFPFTESERDARRAGGGGGEEEGNGEPAQPKRNPSHFVKKPKPSPEEETAAAAAAAEEEAKVPSFPLVDVPDHQLDEEGVKEKRRQRLMKAGYDARMRIKAAKEEQARVEEEERRKDEEQRTNAFEQWRERKRREYEDAIDRIKERKRNQEMLSDRKSLIAQQRMKAITSMASEQGMGAAGGAGGGAPSAKKRRRGPDDDGFGMDDSDWLIYREVHGQDDEEDEEEEKAALASIETTLLKYDPGFTQDDTYAAREERKTHLTTTFLRGHWPAPWDGDDAAQVHQLHLNVERIRVPEVLFQPSMAGVDQAGLDELCAHVLRNLERPVAERLAKNIFVTGQHTLYPGFDERLLSSIRATQPVGTSLGLRRARDVRFDPWRGMARWARECRDEFRAAQVTRAEYEEKGAEWFKEFRFSGCQR
ncbi:Nuclear actin-protein involved in chromatin remodeling [Tilletia horrida]|uniref:Nuclear actin-protein involved in chromatin remodeling n=1 Tax=Tilletia horrida TaxID=155126 RepID=A0AAN6GKJ4_9BASI|nr:Nuclear actin-protein involved in chromatin remodeling [Tilletia horrida]